MPDTDVRTLSHSMIWGHMIQYYNYIALDPENSILPPRRLRAGKNCWRHFTSRSSRTAPRQHTFERDRTTSHSPASATVPQWDLFDPAYSRLLLLVRPRLPEGFRHHALPPITCLLPRTGKTAYHARETHITQALTLPSEKLAYCLLATHEESRSVRRSPCAQHTHQSTLVFRCVAPANPNANLNT